MVRAMIDEDDDFYPVYSEYLYITMNFTAVNVIVESIKISGVNETVSGNGIISTQIPIGTSIDITLFISDDKNTGLNTQKVGVSDLKIIRLPPAYYGG